MSEKTDAMLEMIARNFAVTEDQPPGSRRSEKLSPAGFARLLIAMIETCRGDEECSTCVLCGVGCCPYDRGFDPSTLLPVLTR
jgi:hypothetical protein